MPLIDRTAEERANHMLESATGGIEPGPLYMAHPRYPLS